MQFKKNPPYIAHTALDITLNYNPLDDKEEDLGYRLFRYGEWFDNVFDVKKFIFWGQNKDKNNKLDC